MEREVWVLVVGCWLLVVGCWLLVVEKSEFNIQFFLYC
ncbi:Potassium uptake protein TrkH [Winogradskyella psychrotolerans RS-3]|uniref:Potassium uptake protein TrkH n=1 Tax=Winogradskyella psychrotolerans RS-3 TaxID=641526 RepID=S7VUL6_9FLAO|nr:Potassium uptake protein TrkH [Winogradskyella psychrotolerans RS-3]